jgi:predicted nucleotidyltransferase
MIERFVESVLAWAATRPDVRAIALVGSHARGDARPDSDVDLLLLAERPHELARDADWVRRFGDVSRAAVEDWGRVTSLRVWYAAGPEVEFGLATPDWATAPDEGSLRVVADGFRALLDRDGTLARLVERALA